MSSFATNTVCAHRPLCATDDIEQAVETLSEALQGPAADGAESPATGVREQMKLELVWVNKQQTATEAKS